MAKKNEFNKTLEEKAYEYAINNVCNNCNNCQSKGYIGCDTFRFVKKAYMNCAKELKCCDIIEGDINEKI